MKLISTHKSGLRAFAYGMTTVALLGGCVSPVEYSTNPMTGANQHSGMPNSPARDGVARATVNDGAVQLSEITSRKTPGLKDMINVTASDNGLGANATAEDKLRRPALRDAALSYGARGGLAFTARQINATLQKRSSQLDKIYNFDALTLRGPNNLVVVPPVISQSKDAYEVGDNGSSVRIANQTYEIIADARFSPIAPTWYTYLIRDYSAPENPPDEILPKTADEKAYWEKYIRQGWDAGIEQANDIFKSDLARIDRDLTGMTLYRGLLAEGKVNPPILSEAELGVTGSGRDMRVGDTSVMITMQPTLQIDASKWTPTISTAPSVDDITPKGDVKVFDAPYNGDRGF
jgi:defect-in-organelle-trafficking protein DotC